MTQDEFKNLFEMHFTQVRNYVLYRSGNSDVATDIAQETFIKIWEKQDTIQLNNVKGLLFKIANDLFVSQYRKQQRSFQFFKYYTIDEKTNSPEEIFAFNQLKQNYENALMGMNEKQRTVFLMSRIEQLKYYEIAELLEISVKAVEKRMKGALNYLRKFLKQ